MWFDKQLRGRLSKVLYLCLHGLQGKESDCHNQYASTREVITLPANASGSQVSHEKRPENSPGALLSGCRITHVLVCCRQALLSLSKHAS
ncbi:unnamed protein product, partial [Gulo gulo]